MRVSMMIFLLLIVGCTDQSTEQSPGQASRGNDYLSADLRAQVELLKSAVQSSPTDATTAVERGTIVLDWINAYALNGGYVPVNATQAVSRVSGYGLPSPQEVDELIAELVLHDEQPGALGRLEVNPAGPYVAGSNATFTQTYTVGEAAVQVGGGFLIANHFNANHGRHQVTDSSGANYLSISSDNPAVRFVAEGYPVAGMHGGFRGAQEQLAFRVADANLDPGDRVTITYGDTSGGGPGLVMPDFNSEQMPFPVYLDLDGSDLWLSLPIQPVAVVGSIIAEVTGFAPSVVTPGEQFEVSVRAADQYGNRAQGAIPDWEIRDQQNNLLAQVASQQSAVSVVTLSFPQSGIYRLSVVSADGTISGQFNPVLVEENPQTRIYWGETHGHSGFSEGIGSADAYMQFARDESRLDFVTHSEHDVWMDDSEWELLRRMVQKYGEEGRFLTYLGYEWTISQTQGGHHNILFRTPEGRQRVASQRYPVLSSLYQGLREQNDTKDVLIIPHAHQKGDYRMADPEMETLVEIMSMHGTFEWFARMYLNHGHMVGFVAASDDHIGKPGYSMPKSASLAQRGGLAAVLASEKTTDAVFDAMKSLRTYATSGARMILDVTVNGTTMGQRAAYDETREIQGRVIGTAPIRSMTLFKNEQVLEEWGYNEVGGNDLALSFYSESYPYHPDDNPRGWRHWRGTLEVENATLASATLVDSQNLSVQYVRPDAANPNRVSFSTLTRGDHSTILLSFNESSADATVRINLETSQETGSGPPTLRTHQRIPGQSITLSAAMMENAQLIQSMSFDGYQDSITLSRNTSMPLEAEFSLTDSDNPRQGDYYFLRVRQADEALAWSSPIWVGGAPPR
ncbi:MAG: DUF3604 domain-containing protein [Pseudohongiellaceae bacterium]